MSQIGWCLEEIQIVMSKMPDKIDTNDQIILANDILSKVINLGITLEKIISDKKFKDILYKLEHQTFEGVKFQAQHIENFFNELHQMLDMLSRYVLNLRKVIDNKDHVTWQNSAGDIVKMIILDFSNKYYELREEFKVVLHTQEQLRELQVYEQHLNKVLK